MSSILIFTIFMNYKKIKVLKFKKNKIIYIPIARTFSSGTVFSLHDIIKNEIEDKYHSKLNEYKLYNPTDYHKYIEKFFLKSSTEINSLKNYFIFSVVRHPFYRFSSMFSEIKSGINTKLARHIRNEIKDFTINNFMTYLENTSDDKINKHLRSQTYTLKHVIDNVNKIIKFEDMYCNKKHLSEIINKNLKISIKIKNIYYRRKYNLDLKEKFNIEDKHKDFSFLKKILNQKICNRISLRYKKDFLNFGYKNNLDNIY